MAERTAARKSRSPAWSLLLLVAAAVFASQPSCLETREDPRLGQGDTRCASCHGDPARWGDFLRKAAPPRDLDGSTDRSYPGVGAHSIHLNRSSTHAAIACDECHVVPDRTDALGHADSPRPAEITFGAIARSSDMNPSYDPVTRQCTNSWCHRNASAHWTAPRSSKDACGTCHGLPPPAPHPQSDRCSICHADVIAADRHFVNPALHVDGVAETTQADCGACHGRHDNPAPPPDTTGHTESSALAVGAHAAHLDGGSFSRPLDCSECHRVPEPDKLSDHIQGGPADVQFSGVAQTKHPRPTWDRTSARCSNTWCHGPTAGTQAASPRWNEPAELGCRSCHGTPPPAPHPQIDDCARCHGDVVNADNVSIRDRSRHIDGVVDVAFDPRCTACHGGRNPAPPADLTGNVETTAPGVGAHRVHLAGTPRSRPVACAECHRVPAEVLAPGHVDTPAPAEVLFSGVASAFGGLPVYVEGQCQNISCHGAVFPAGHASGGALTMPKWTVVDGTQAPCGACHGLPPPPPHPYQDHCSMCHEDVAGNDTSFLRPDLHVDGIVTFTVH